jgi:glycosyltransferase involved in cell wall biosynthesis
MPRVSVVIPTRDRPHMLRDAIASVRAQSFAGYEIIVVINGPDTPQTAEAMAAAAACHVVRIKEGGIARALNAGIRAARGEWVAFLDDDDLWEQNRLELALDAAAKTGADVIVCDYALFDESGATRNPPLRPPAGLAPRQAMTLKNYFGGCSVTMAKRSALMAEGGFDPSFVSPDWDLWMRLSWRHTVTWLDAYLVWVRLHGRNTSTRISWAGGTLRILTKALRTLPPDLHAMRPRLVMEMLKVATKGSESYLRRRWLKPFKRVKPLRPRSELRPPLPARSSAGSE